MSTSDAPVVPLHEAPKLTPARLAAAPTNERGHTPPCDVVPSCAAPSAITTTGPDGTAYGCDVHAPIVGDARKLAVLGRRREQLAAAMADVERQTRRAIVTAHRTHGAAFPKTLLARWGHVARSTVDRWLA